MEGQESTRKKDERKTQISQGKSDGIGGVLVLGGALALACLIAIFTIKNRRSQKYPKVCQTNQRETSDTKKKIKEEKACAFSQHLQPLVIHDAPSMLVFYLSLWLICNFTSHGTSKISVTYI